MDESNPFSIYKIKDITNTQLTLNRKGQMNEWMYVTI